MEYSESEIVCRLREARNLNAQIKIEAELNLVSRVEILKVAYNHDISVHSPKPHVIRNNHADYMPFYEQGLSDTKIARATESSYHAVASWRYRNKLPNQSKRVLNHEQ
jgi:hypothetical protein